MNKELVNKEYSGIKNRPRMSLYQRAAQFAPFAALKGHEEALEKTEEDYLKTFLP